MTTADYVLIQGSMISGKNPVLPAASVVVPSDDLGGNFRSIHIEPGGVFLLDGAGLRFLLDGMDVDASIVLLDDAQVVVCREIQMDSDGWVEYPIAVKVAPEYSVAGPAL